MLCKKPYQLDGLRLTGCSQCMSCRINRRRLWTNRLLLESKKHSDACFVTLTYAPEFEPFGNLIKRHYQLFLKSLRRRTKLPLRFFCVGEYGDESWRPHFHLAIFGFPSCWNYPGYDAQSKYLRARCGCLPCVTIREVWKKGRTDCATLTKDSSQYIAGYVTKKLTFEDDPRLLGRNPEFAQMSLRPGIGATAIDEIADVLTTEVGCDWFVKNGDVPEALQMGSMKMPLGRYLRSKLRQKMNMDMDEVKKSSTLKWVQEVREMLAQARETPSNKAKGVWEITVNENKQRVLSLEARNKIWSKKGSL